mmetsp:Transcript_22093/g.28586  ORF Transcript_22093/g.28586 Transcript_22093/m.28586 type:complete len:174 (-) Transcript_22093:461-982(-)
MVIIDSNPLPLQHHRAFHDGSSPTFDATQTLRKAHRNLHRRGVKFSRNVSIVQLSPLSDKEKQDIFYGRKDRRMFDQDRVQSCRLFEKKYRSGEPWCETDDVTLRGLEDFFGRFSKEQIRKMHAQKVLKEQSRQRILGECCDRDTIRYVSCESSGEGRMNARRIAEQDAIYIT